MCFIKHLATTTETVQNVTQYFMESTHTYYSVCWCIHDIESASLPLSPAEWVQLSAKLLNDHLFCARKWRIIGKYFEETYGSELENIWLGIPFSKWRNARIHDFRKSFIFSGNRTSVTTRPNALHRFYCSILLLHVNTCVPKMRQVVFPFVFEFDSPNGNLENFTSVKIPYLPDQLLRNNTCATFTTGLIFARWSKQGVAILYFD